MCTKKELQFSIFLIYNLAEKWQKKPADVYKILNETNVLDEKLVFQKAYQVSQNAK